MPRIRDVHGNPIPIPNRNPIGMGITGENENENGRFGREWESTSTETGMTPIPMGICSHHDFRECKLLYSYGVAVDTEHCFYIVSTFVLL